MADYDLLIVGCGPAALSCAITARKRDLKCLVACAPTPMGWLQRAEQIDNYPGLPAVSGRELLAVFEEQARDLGAAFITGQVRQIQPMGDEYMALVGNDVIMSKAVVLATGASRPSLLPGEEELLGKGVSWCGTCDGMFFRNKKVAVISYWQGGAQEALFLARLCSGVDYYAVQPHEIPDHEKINPVDAKPLSLKQEEKQIVVTCNDKERTYEGVFIFRPSVAPDRLIPGLMLDGPFIHTDRNMRTSLSKVYACGDCTGKPLQIAKAVGQGNIAAITAAQELMK